MRARLLLAWKLREWPWRIPASVVRIAGQKRPPEHVFEFFRRLHGVEAKGRPGKEQDG